MNKNIEIENNRASASGAWFESRPYSKSPAGAGSISEPVSGSGSGSASDSESGFASERSLMSVKEMGGLLGLKKTESYRLAHMGYFGSKILYGKTWIDKESFESWYANQIHYIKTDGEPPGKNLTDCSYSIRDISRLLSISESSAYALVKRERLDTIETNDQRRVTKACFENWYAGQTRYTTKIEKKKEESQKCEKEKKKKQGAEQELAQKKQCEHDPGRKKDETTGNSIAPAVIQEPPAYYTILQASGLAGVSRATVSSWISDGKIPSIRIGRSVYIPSADLYGWLRTRNDQ